MALIIEFACTSILRRYALSFPSVKRDVCTSLALLDVVTVKQSVFADVMLGGVRFAENRVVLLAAKLVFDAVFDNVLFHKFIFLSFKKAL